MEVKRERYICIQEFMVRDLELKGNELIVYALVYGFTQDGEQFFSGSLNYIADWINASKSTAQSIVKSLLEKGLLVKKDNYVNNVKFCAYKTAVPDNADNHTGNPNAVPESGMGCTENRYGGVPDSDMGCTENRYGGVPDSGTNNNIYNTNNNLDNNKYILSGKPDDVSVSTTENVHEKPGKPKKPKSKTHPEEVKQIIEYFNHVCGTNYRYQSKATADMINARINDGFTVEDFRKVIETKYADWHNDSDRCKYLRPETLFRPSHFESYLNQRSAPSAGSAGGISKEMSDLYNALIIE